MNARTIAGLVAVGCLCALAAPGTAQAWRHTRLVWSPQDLPYLYTISNYNEDSLPVGVAQTEVQLGYAAWEDAQCADLPTLFLGTTALNTAYSYNFQNHTSFDDPGDALSPGTLAATLTLPPVNSGQAMFIYEGQVYFRALDSDIVFNNDTQWMTEAEIDGGSCAGEFHMASVATHEIGHSYGMDHSCEQADVCAEVAADLGVTVDELLEATMYWSIGPCDTYQATIADDDEIGLNVLYGPSAVFDCSHLLDPSDPNTLAQGNVPFELRCVTRSEFAGQITSATWHWGDGQTTEGGLQEAHTYTEAGTYSMRVCYDGTHDTCGDWSNCFTRTSYVRACDVPVVDMDIAHVDGLTYTLLNQTDISIYGCITDVQWDIYEGSTLLDSLQAWEPDYTFVNTGEHRVVLNVGGPAGSSASEITFDVKNRRGSGYGCNSAAIGGVGSASGVFLMLGMLGFRRRRA